MEFELDYTGILVQHNSRYTKQISLANLYEINQSKGCDKYIFLVTIGWCIIKNAELSNVDFKYKQSLSFWFIGVAKSYKPLL